MTDIRALLREASRDIEIDAADPAARVRDALRRRRRSHAAILAVVAAVATAIVVPISVRGSKPPVAAIEPGPAPDLKHWDASAGSATSGFGSMWALRCCDLVSGESWVDQLDPVTGRQTHRIPVPLPTSSIAAGAGYVWVIGANPGGGAPSAITAIDPNTHNYYSMRITDPTAEPYDIGFADGAAWVTIPLENAVWRLTVDPSAYQLRKSVVAVPGGPADIATTPDGQLWVQEASADTIVQIDPGTRTSIAHAPWPGHIFGPTTVENHGLVGTTKPNTWVALDPYDLARPPGGGPMGCQGCVDFEYRVPGQIRDVVSTGAGVFVWRTGKDGTDFASFWSRHDLSTGDSTPTESIPVGGPLAADSQDQGVVIGTHTGLFHWRPTGGNLGLLESGDDHHGVQD
ncbi:MAG TPA: hypothetical protein VHD81_07945 [Mycobacteriales bacterium]|nr:hypothetical protein [Mycobacteriales bacterium]